MSKVIYIYKLFHKNYIKYPKCYIGSTCNFEKRKNDHKWNVKNDKSRKYNYKVYRYMRKHGVENFDFFVLNVHQYKSNADTRKLEQQYIDLFKPQLNRFRATKKKKKIKKKKMIKSDDESSTE